MALQALVGRPPVLFDSCAAITALEEVVHLAQKYVDERYSRYQIILRKCRPLVADASLQNILIKLVASKEEAEIAKAIEKARKSSQAEKSFFTACYSWENKGTLLWIPKRSWVPKMPEMWLKRANRGNFSWAWVGIFS